MSFNYFTDTGFINLLREYVNKATPAFQTGILQVLFVDNKRVMFATEYLVRDGKDNLTRQYNTYLILKVDGGFEHSVIVQRSDNEDKKVDRTIPNTVELADLADQIFTLGTTGNVGPSAKQAGRIEESSPSITN